MLYLSKSTNGRVAKRKHLKNSNDGRKIFGTFLFAIKLEFWCEEKEKNSWKP